MISVWLTARRASEIFESDLRGDVARLSSLRSMPQSYDVSQGAGTRCLSAPKDPLVAGTAVRHALLSVSAVQDFGGT